MTFANLTINVNANTLAAQKGLQDVGATARSSMLQSADAVTQFQAHLNRASEDLAAASRQLGGSMDAANDAIAASAEQSEKAVDHLVDHVENVEFHGLSERVAAAFGAAFGAGYVAAQTWLEKTEQWVETKAKVIGIGLAIGVVSATAAAVYTAYKIISGTLGFINGLFTGDSYKSANIDALIAANKQVLELQKSLSISAQEAAAINDALDRKGVSKADYVTAQEGATKAMRSNGDELDRLGIKYKNANGQLLEQQEFLQNVKDALDQYTIGYDRNAAAVAIGAGSYDQISAALKINQAELEQSKARLDEYGLAIGPQTQAAVDAYTAAMREFDHESKLTSEGFKRAVADNIMPVLTDLATFFRDGFPTAVRVFRYTMATVTSLLYGIKTTTYIVAESVLGLIESMGAGIGGLGTALVKVFQGDFSGAKEAMLKGWNDAKDRFAQIGSNIVTQAAHNRDAIIMAWGLDDRTDSLAGSKAQPTGKAWVPKPPPAPPPAADVKSPYQTYLDELDRMVKKVQENEYASMRLKAEQLAQKEGITDLTEAYAKINAIQRGESQKVVDEYTRKLREETDLQKAQTDMLGKTSFEQSKLTNALQKRMELERLIEQSKKSGKPLDDAAIAALRAQTEATIALSDAESDRRRAIERSADFGSNKAVDDYLDTITNKAQQAGNMVTNTFKGMEDALVNFVKTGKLDFSSLADSIISDLIRIEIQRSIMQPITSAFKEGGISGVFGMIGGGIKSLLGFADGGDPPVGVPSIVGENGPELFVPKTAGTIIPNGASTATAAALAPVINNYNFTVGDVATVSMVRRAITDAQRASIGAAQRSQVYA